MKSKYVGAEWGNLRDIGNFYRCTVRNELNYPGHFKVNLSLNVNTRAFQNVRANWHFSHNIYHKHYQPLQRFLQKNLSRTNRWRRDVCTSWTDWFSWYSFILNAIKTSYLLNFTRFYTLQPYKSANCSFHFYVVNSHG